MSSSFSIGEGRPPGEMPSIDPSSMDTDETFAAIISRDDTGKLTVARRDHQRPAETTVTKPTQLGEGAESKDRGR